MPDLCRLAVLTAAAISLSVPLAAHAQIAGREASEGAARLGECVVGNSTGNDRVLVAQWIGLGLASAPQLSGMVTVDQARKIEIDQQIASLIVRLMTRDCIEEARPLLEQNDAMAVQVAFGMLGESAVRELSNNPQAMEAMSSYMQYIPPDAFARFRRK